MKINRKIILLMLTIAFIFGIVIVIANFMKPNYLTSDISLWKNYDDSSLNILVKYPPEMYFEKTINHGNACVWLYFSGDVNSGSEFIPPGLSISICKITNNDHLTLEDFAKSDAPYFVYEKVNLNGKVGLKAVDNSLHYYFESNNGSIIKTYGSLNKANNSQKEYLNYADAAEKIFFNLTIY